MKVTVILLATGITDDCNLRSIVLECLNAVQRHYSNNVGELYKQFAAEWDITKKIKAFVTDNARTMVSAVNQSGFARIPCMAHSLQLSILHGLKAADTETLLGRCRKIVGHFKHSDANTTELKKYSDSPLRNYSKKFQQDGTVFL